MDKPEVKRHKTHPIRFTRFELLHLRDLMSVSLPPEGRQTLSHALAVLENRPLVESFLWRKLSAACEQAGLPMGDEAPDYIVAPTSPPPMGVFQLAHEPAAPGEAEEAEEAGEEDPDAMFGGVKEK